MKKLIVFLSIFTCILGLVSCSGKSDNVDMIDIIEIGGLVTEKGYTEKE